MTVFKIDLTDMICQIYGRQGRGQFPLWTYM